MIPKNLVMKILDIINKTNLNKLLKEKGKGLDSKISEKGSNLLEVKFKE